MIHGRKNIKYQFFVVCFLLGNSPPSEIYIPTFRNNLFHLHGRLWRWNRQSVPKRRHIKFRRRGITQKKAYNIQNKAKVWNQVSAVWCMCVRASYMKLTRDTHLMQQFIYYRK